MTPARGVELRICLICTPLARRRVLSRLPPCFAVPVLSLSELLVFADYEGPHVRLLGWNDCLRLV